MASIPAIWDSVPPPIRSQGGAVYWVTLRYRGGLREVTYYEPSAAQRARLLIRTCDHADVVAQGEYRYERSDWRTTTGS